MSTADKLNKLLETKQAIKQAIINKGVEVADDTKFADYPSKINSIPMEGGDPYYEDLYNMRTSNGSNMAGLFFYCRTPELDLSKLDTSNAINMSYMFANSSSSVNITGWNTNEVTDMSYMFNFFYGSIDISKLDTSSLINVYKMFDSANTDNIILTGLSFPKVTSLSNMFSSSKGTTLDLSSWDISNVTSMYYMFNSATYKKIDLTGWKTTNVTDMGYMFYGFTSYLEELIIPDWDMTNVTSNSSFLYSSFIRNLKFIDLSRSNDATITKITSFLPTRTADTSGTIKVPGDTSQEVCDALTAKYWIPEKSEEPEVPVDPPAGDIPLYEPGEFRGNTEITEVVTMVNESHTDLSYMFESCTNLTSVNTQDWDVSNVTTVNCMFSNTYGMPVTSLDFSTWDTGNVTTMDSMFSYMQSCSLPKIDLSSFTTKKLQQAYSMFLWCNALQELDIRNFELVHEDGTEAAISSMLEGCNELRILRLDNCSNATIRKIINESGMPQEPVYDYSISENINRKMYCKASEIGDLVAPNGWEFVTVE